MTAMTMRYTDPMPVPSLGARELKRLTRPATVPPYRIQERDERLLEGLARFRFMTTDQLARWAGGSVRGVKTRLYRLWADGLIERPQQQAVLLGSYFHHGDLPRIHALTRKGATFLKERMPMAHRLDWSFRTGSTPNLLHTLETAGFMIDVHAAVAAHPGLAIDDHHDLIPWFPEATQNADRPFGLAVTVGLEKTGRHGTRVEQVALTNVPDRLFSLYRGDVQRFNFAVEWDRSSESHRASKLTTKSNTRRKQLVYAGAFDQDLYRAQWGFKQLRVLTITGSEARLANMIDCQNEITGGELTQMFLYATAARLKSHGVFGPAWRSAAGDGICLLPEAALATPSLMVS